jgi:tetratricopeptide (TPR) repeat protein
VASKFLGEMLHVGDARGGGRAVHMTVPQLLARAEANLDAALKDNRYARGIVLLSLARSYNNYDTGKMRVLAERAVQDLSATIGPAHGNTIDARVTLGNAYLSSGEKVAARSTFESAMADLSRYHPGSHGGYEFEIRRQLAGAAMSDSDWPESRKQVRAMIALMNADPTVGEGLMPRMESMLQLYDAMENVPGAADRLMASYREQLKEIDADSPRALSIGLNIGAVLEAAERYDEAERAYIENLEGRRATYGADSHLTRLPINGLADVAEKRGRWEEAARWRRELIANSEAQEGRGGASVARAMVGLHRALLGAGRVQEAETLADDAAKRARAAIDEGRSLSSEGLISWADLLAAAGRSRESKWVLTEGLKATGWPEDDPRARGVRERANSITP